MGQTIINVMAKSVDKTHHAQQAKIPWFGRIWLTKKVDKQNGIV